MSNACDNADKPFDPFATESRAVWRALLACPGYVEQLTGEDVRGELTREGLDPAAAVASLRGWLTEVLTRPTVCPIGERDCGRVTEVLDDLGSECPEVARCAAEDYLSLWHDERDELVYCLGAACEINLADGPRTELLARIAGCRDSGVVMAYREQVDSITPDDAARWLRESTRLHPLGRHLFAAAVLPAGKEFTAALVRFGDDYVALYNVALPDGDRAEAVNEELGHLARIMIDEASHRPGDAVGLTPAELSPVKIEEPRRIIPYAVSQLKHNSDEKKIVAHWVAHEELRLASGAGIYVDAGSSCLELWLALVEQLRRGEFSHITAYTNNFMVLTDWSDKVGIPELQSMSVRMAGTTFDPFHRALYGESIRHALMSGNFRPSVYIGTSGIEFDESGSIQFGYHADEELEVKQLYFQCPAKRRIILATAPKIGDAGGKMFDVLSVNGMDTRAPIYLVTTAPDPRKQKEVDQFNQAFDVFHGEKIQSALRNRGLKFYWKTVDRTSPPKLIEPDVVRSNAARPSANGTPAEHHRVAAG